MLADDPLADAARLLLFACTYYRCRYFLFLFFFFFFFTKKEESIITGLWMIMCNFSDCGYERNDFLHNQGANQDSTACLVWTRRAGDDRYDSACLCAAFCASRASRQADATARQLGLGSGSRSPYGQPTETVSSSGLQSLLLKASGASRRLGCERSRPAYVLCSALRCMHMQPAGRMRSRRVQIATTPIRATTTTVRQWPQRSLCAKL